MTLWLLTNTAGTGLMTAVLLLFTVWRGEPAAAFLMGLFGGLIAAGYSLMTIPPAALLFHLLPRLRSFRHRQLGAALGLTLLFLLPLLLVLAWSELPGQLLLFALAYWPAALACALYLYHPWLFAPTPADAEPWV